MGLPLVAAAAGSGAAKTGAIQAGIQSAGGIFATMLATRANKKAWKRSVAHEQKVWERDSAYNSPAAQMQRLKEAGLNPNLMYGQGTVGNTSGKPMQSESFMRGAEPFMQLTTGAFMDGLMFAAELRKKNNEADLIGKKETSEGIKQGLMQAQQQVLQANPYLNHRFMESFLLKVESESRIKEAEAGAVTMQMFDGSGFNQAERKVQAEIELLEQRYNLGQKDLAIKAKIFESKEFQNALQEIQVNWMRDASVTPEHIRTGIMMLLQKLMTK